MMRKKKNIKWTVIIACAGLILFFNSTEGFSKEYHVSSIKEANAVGNPGDIIFIAAGTYETPLKPLNSGQPGKYITYKSNGGEVTITASECGVDLKSRSYVCIDGLRFIDVKGPWIDMQEASHYSVIKNCYMEGAVTWSGISMKGASYNRFLNNYMRGTCPCTDECLGSGRGGPHDLVYLVDGHHNLFDGNEMYDGIHDNIDIQDHTDGSTNFNIIRNNFISNKWHGNIDVWGVEYLLVENNTVVDGGESHLTNYCSRSERDIYAERWRHKGILINTQFSIVRNNIVVNNGRGIALFSAIHSKKYPWKCNAAENRIYHNTVTENQYGILHNNADPAIDNILKNNILYKNKQYEVSTFVGEGTPSTNHFISNNIYGSEEQYSPDDERISNMAIKDPQFVDTSNRNFHLKVGSPMIDAGAWLTITTNSGKKSKIIQVEDARYFTDGWELIEGDFIQLEGQSQKVRIEKVDYETNTLTLVKKISWDKGIGISIPYKGKRPDLGAFEASSEK